MKEASHKRSHVVWFHLHEMSRIMKSIETESRLVTTAGAGAGAGVGDWEKWVTANVHRVLMVGVENVLKLNWGDCCTTRWIH